MDGWMDGCMYVCMSVRAPVFMRKLCVCARAGVHVYTYA